MPTYVVLYKTFTRGSHFSFSGEFTQFLKMREHLAILFSKKGRETVKVYLKSAVTVLESWGYGFWCYCSDTCSLQREKNLGYVIVSCKGFYEEIKEPLTLRERI